MSKISYRRGIISYKNNEFDFLGIVQTLGVVLLTIIAFFQGAQFKEQQREQIMQFCGVDVINLTAKQPSFEHLNTTFINSKKTNKSNG